MHLNSILNIVNEQYASIIKDSSNKENILSDYFRQNKFIGSKERKIIQEITFSAIRNHILLENIKKYFKLSDIYTLLYSVAITEIVFENKMDNALINAVKLYKSKSEFNSFFEFVTDSLEIDREPIINNINLFVNKIKEKDEIELIENLYSFPLFLIDSLNVKLETNKIKSIAKELLNKANTTIRVNKTKSNLDDVEVHLKENDYDYIRSSIHEDALIISERKSINNLSYYIKGYFEIQDEGSMFVAQALDVENGDKILDACAGAGGKSIHLASITDNKCSIHAFDINSRKLNALKKRKDRNNASSIKVIQKKELKSDYYDFILIDAPCTGSGTIKRNPALKYKINKEMLQKYQSLQIELLNYYSKFLKKGGKLIYSTCSILPQENEDVINDFMRQNKSFAPNPLPDNNTFNKIKESNNSHYTTIYPDDFQTDAFFICKMIKT